MRDKLIGGKRMTRKLYYEDTYLKAFEAEVVSCTPYKEGYMVVLDQTAFNPEGGGQLSDQGYLGECFVKEVKIKADEVQHYTDKPLEVGTRIKGQIDFARRFDLMQQHSGEHIISGIINKLYGYNNVGFHLGLDNMTADLDGELTREQILEVERLANEVVYQNIPIQSVHHTQDEVKDMTYRSKIDIEGLVRIVSVEGVDQCACCGTHVAATGEIGMIKFTNWERHRGGMRLTMACGMRALRDYQMKQDIVAEIMALLSAKPDKIIGQVKGVQEELTANKFRVTALQNDLFEHKANKLADTAEEVVCVIEEGLLPDALRRFCLRLMETTHKLCIVLTQDGTGYKYALGHESLDIRALCKAMNGAFNGKGGGSKELAQGSLQGSSENIVSFLKDQLHEIEAN